MWRGAQKGSRRRLNQHRGAGEAPSGSFARETSSANDATLPPEDVDTATSSHVLNVTELELPTITAQPGQPAPERSGHRFINPQYQPSIASITLSKGRSTVSAPALREEHRRGRHGACGEHAPAVMFTHGAPAGQRIIRDQR